MGWDTQVVNDNTSHDTQSVIGYWLNVVGESVHPKWHAIYAAEHIYIFQNALNRDNQQHKINTVTSLSHDAECEINSISTKCYKMCQSESVSKKGTWYSMDHQEPVWKCNQVDSTPDM